jgi:plasmid stabilization system protein ParE
MNLHDSAEEELKAAITYYEECERGLGDELFEEVLKGFEQIRQRPNAWPTIYKNFRRYLINRFPYALVYRVAHDELMILAVAHTSRRPGYWRERGQEQNISGPSD